MASRARAPKPTPAPRLDSETKATIARHAADVAGLMNRTDGWQNILTGLGTATRDKRTRSVPVPTRLEYAQAMALWEADDMAARIIEKPPREMTRKGFTVHVEGEPDIAEEIAARVDELDVRGKFYRAMCLARAVRGSLILMGADDGAKDLRQELVPENVRAVRFLHVLDAQDAQPVEWYADPLAPQYGEPSVYRIQPSWVAPSAAGNPNAARSHDVHASRVIRFDGVWFSDKEAARRNGWGESVLSRVFGVLQDFSTAWGGSAHILSEFAAATYKMKGLATLLAAKRDQEVIQRLLIQELAASTVRARVVDADGEDYTRQQTPVAGLSDLLAQWCNRVAAAAEMPVTMLMGQAPAGLNATGAADVRFWYDQIASERETVLRPRLNKLVRLLMLAKEGPTRGKEPDNWSLSFPALWEPTGLERAQERKAVAETDAIYLASRVLTPAIVARQRFGGDCYNPDTALSEEELAEVENAAEAAAEMEAAIATAATEPPGDGEDDAGDEPPAGGDEP